MKNCQSSTWCYLACCTVRAPTRRNPSASMMCCKMACRSRSPLVTRTWRTASGGWLSWLVCRSTRGVRCMLVIKKLSRVGLRWSFKKIVKIKLTSGPKFMRIYWSNFWIRCLMCILGSKEKSLYKQSPRKPIICLSHRRSERRSKRNSQNCEWIIFSDL